MPLFRAIPYHSREGGRALLRRQPLRGIVRDCLEFALRFCKQRKDGKIGADLPLPFFMLFSFRSAFAAGRAGRAARAHRSSAPSQAHLPARFFASGRPADQITQHDQRRAQHGEKKPAHEAQKRQRYARDDQHDPQSVGRVQLFFHGAALTSAAAMPSSVHSDHLEKRV